MTRLFNTILKTTFPQYTCQGIRSQSATFTQVQNLCNSLSRASPFARNPSGLLKHSYSSCVKGALSVLSGLVFSSYLGVHQSVALCAPQDAGNDLENLPSEIQGYSRKELKDAAPNLFKYFYTMGFRRHEEGRKIDFIVEANACKELMKIGEKVLENTNGNDVCIILGDGGSGKSTLISYLTGSKLKREKREGKLYYSYDVDPSQKVSSSSPISHGSSGTSIPMAVQKDALILVDMPGMDDTRGDLITIVNSMLLEKIINGAKSVSFVIVVGENAVSATRGIAWERNFNIIADSIGYSKKDIKNFKLTEKNKSPIMLLVNPTNSKDPIETPTDKALEEAITLINLFKSKYDVAHLAYTYSPEQTSVADVYNKLLSLQRAKHDVKVVPSIAQINFILNKINASINTFSIQIGSSNDMTHIKVNSSIESFEAKLKNNIIPCLKYCQTLNDFSGKKTVEKFEKVRNDFEKQVFQLLSDSIDFSMDRPNDSEAIKLTSKEEAEKIANLVLYILEEIEITPYLTNAIVSKLSPDVLPKTSPHVAGVLTILGTTVITGLANWMITAQTVTITVPLLSATVPVAAVIMPVAVTIGGIWNFTQGDQWALHEIGEKTKPIPIFNPSFQKVVYQKPKLENFVSAYDKILEKVSEKNTECEKKRNLERKKVKALLNDIKDLFSQPYVSSSSAYSTNRDEIDAYLRSEDFFYGKSTERFVEDIAKKTLPRSGVTSEDKYKEKNKDLHKWINTLACEDKDYFEEFDNDDIEEVMSKIKSLRVALDRLYSAQMEYIDYSVVKKQTEIAKASVERKSPSWGMSAATWSFNKVGEASSAIGRLMHSIWGKSAEPETPKETLQKNSL